MGVEDILDSAFSEHFDEPLMRVVASNQGVKSSIKYVQRRKCSLDEQPRIRVVSGGKREPLRNYFARKRSEHRVQPNTPTRYELSRMRERLNSHRRWIQLGLVIGALGIGSKIPGIIGWYQEVHTDPVIEQITTKQQILPTYRPPRPIEREQRLEQVVETYQPAQVVPVEPRRVSYQTQPYEQPKKALPRPRTKPSEIVKQDSPKEVKEQHSSAKSSKPKLIVAPGSFAEWLMEDNESADSPMSPQEICVKKWNRCYRRDARDSRERRTFRKLAEAYGYQ